MEGGKRGTNRKENGHRRQGKKYISGKSGPQQVEIMNWFQSGFTTLKK